ncbi:NAD-dependent epimerase [Hydrogenimonas cancrithermarum]|uniref:NAD-dependent epimerase n=1 Tax=Hydrogenimonas cancrithermarum TaxID=2993563 RepID=A0ABN6WVP9_9BACT|nr:NAD-dependent epimerase [Hydrogenimonas cancrithermarum]BDY13165.1 NAD-dependent epimerase [Hydrogenimonas cancrithermarum]
MKILVTGTAGFIGYHLAKRLLEEGHEVVGIDNINDYYDVNLKYGRLRELGIEERDVSAGKRVKSRRYDGHAFYLMDLADTPAIERLFKEEKFDAVCNLAAQAGVRYSLENPMAYIRSNVTGFANILEGCRNHEVENLCYASSSSVYGLNKSMPFRVSDSVDHPVSLYAATKKGNELMAHTYSHLYGIRTTGLRFFTVYGPWGRPDMAPMLFADAILNDRPINVFNYGKMQRDFTYIDDIVEGVVKVIENPAKANEDFDFMHPDPASSPAPYRVYNIGNGKPVKLMDFILTLEKHLGKKAQMNMMPMQPGDVEATWADTSALERDVGYSPSTDLDRGIEKFIEWYRSYYL